MKRFIALSALVLLFACNNSKKEAPIKGEKTTAPGTNTTDTKETPAGTTNNVIASVEGKEIQLNGSILVSKDKDKLQPGADYFVMLTASGGNNKESLTLNFLMALKEGTYPVVGTSLVRGEDDKSEMYGGLLGGKAKITEYKVNLSEVKDLGSNNLGGHKWSISGSFDAMTIPAMGIMMMDQTKNHPKEVKIDKVSFSNLTFDDNWEEIMEKAMEQMKKK
jgi:hypothetical protein